MNCFFSVFRSCKICGIQLRYYWFYLFVLFHTRKMEEKVRKISLNSSEVSIDLSRNCLSRNCPEIHSKDFERVQWKNNTFNLSQSVLDRLYIVTKSSHEEKFNKNTTEWSYSFCHIENYIFTDVFTDTHNLIYLVTKSIFKKHIQPLDNNLRT